MLITTEDLYLAYLDGIKNMKTSTVTPTMFNRDINLAQDTWLVENIPSVDIAQDKIDMLQSVRVITDSVMVVDGVILNPIAPNTSYGNIFDLPIDPDAEISIDTAEPPKTQKFPRYLRGLSVMFKVEYDDACSLSGISDWKEAILLKANAKTASLMNHYRKPTHRRLMYDVKNNTIELYLENASAYRMKLEYFRWPDVIFYDEVTPVNSIPCELHPLVREAIVNIAIRTYLEINKDPRYQTYIKEQLLKKQNQITNLQI
jgi:hypothetical protein